MKLKVRGPSVASVTVAPAALWIVGLAIASGCDGDFNSCRASRTCPAAPAGAAGGAGQPGSGSFGAGRGGADQGEIDGSSMGGVPTDLQGADEPGDGPGGENIGGGGGGDRGPGAGGTPAECRKDADCDDGLYCDGEETCESGACRDGTAPCENPDEADCAVTCKEGNTAASCVVKGKDADADGHLSTACPTEPGDDCDDTRDDIHPGAKELCDGVDHDCDGKLGLDDGLTVSGSSEQIGDVSHTNRSSPSVAWSDVSSAYGLVWVDSDSPDGAIQFMELNQTGQIVTAAQAAGGTEDASDAPDIAWGSDSFGIAWAGRYTNDESFGAIYFRRLDAAGAALSLTQTVTYEGDTRVPRVTRVADEPWVVQFPGCSLGCYISACLVPPGKPAESRMQGPQLDNDLTALAATASNLVTSYENEGTSHAELRDPRYASVKTINTVGTDALLGASASRFAVVTRQSSGKPTFALFDANGDSTCGPVEIGDSIFVPSAVAGGENGFLVVSSGHVRGQVISDTCVPGSIFEIDSGSASASRVAAGDKGYAVVWSDATTGLPRRRLFGSRICD